MSKTDDHLKNHGFIYSGLNQWRLAPAFDINPSPSRHRLLETSIIQGESFDASISMAPDACEFFDLPIDEARHMAQTMGRLLRHHWRQALRDEGCSVEEIRGYKDAFEHEQSSFAEG